MEESQKITARIIQNSKRLPADRHGKAQKLTMLTAYDYPFAKILDEAGVEIVLVGDSLGNVVLGLPSTRRVTMADMLHHTRAAARGVTRALVVADVPFRSLSLANARRLIAAGAEAVKVEGVSGIRTVKQMVDAGIPVMGHLGYLPQTDKKPKIKRSDLLIKQAKQLEQAGAFALVLELVEPGLAKRITQALSIPTIGIGSGRNCDGQVLVTYDLIGLSAWSPRFVRPKINLKRIVLQAVKEFISDLAP